MSHLYFCQKCLRNVSRLHVLPTRFGLWKYRIICISLPETVKRVLSIIKAQLSHCRKSVGTFRKKVFHYLGKFKQISFAEGSRKITTAGAFGVVSSHYENVYQSLVMRWLRPTGRRLVLQQFCEMNRILFHQCSWWKTFTLMGLECFI